MRILFLDLLDLKRIKYYVLLIVLLITELVRLFRENLNIEGEYEYLESWLRKFKRYGIKYLKIFSENVFVDYKVVENYTYKFVKIIFDENFNF